MNVCDDNRRVSIEGSGVRKLLVARVRVRRHVGQMIVEKDSAFCHHAGTEIRSKATVKKKMIF